MDGMTPGEDPKLDEKPRPLGADYHRPDGCHLYGRPHRGPCVDLDAMYRAAFEEGYADAVARLRDDDRYRDWWTATPERSFGTAYWAPDGRGHLADYLETVGVDQ